MELTVSPYQAAIMIRDDYLGENDAQVTERLCVKGVQASIRIVDNFIILIIRGTNQFSDWFRYNLRCLHEHDQGVNCRWHRGFFNYSRPICEFIKGKEVNLVIGHSLGAAAMQIVCSDLGIPGMGFASPRPLWGGTQPPNAHGITNYCRPDDLVTMIPPTFLGFHHVGLVNWLGLKGRNVGEDHGIENYIELLDEPDELARALAAQRQTC